MRPTADLIAALELMAIDADVTELISAYNRQVLREAAQRLRDQEMRADAFARWLHGQIEYAQETGLTKPKDSAPAKYWQGWANACQNTLHKLTEAIEVGQVP